MMDNISSSLPLLLFVQRIWDRIEPYLPSSSIIPLTHSSSPLLIQNSIRNNNNHQLQQSQSLRPNKSSKDNDTLSNIPELSFTIAQQLLTLSLYTLDRITIYQEKTPSTNLTSTFNQHENNHQYKISNNYPEQYPEILIESQKRYIAATSYFRKELERLRDTSSVLVPPPSNNLSIPSNTLNDEHTITTIQQNKLSQIAKVEEITKEDELPLWKNDDAIPIIPLLSSNNNNTKVQTNPLSILATAQQNTITTSNNTRRLITQQRMETLQRALLLQKNTSLSSTIKSPNNITKSKNIHKKSSTESESSSASSSSTDTMMEQEEKEQENLIDEMTNTIAALKAGGQAVLERLEEDNRLLESTNSITTGNINAITKANKELTAQYRNIIVSLTQYCGYILIIVFTFFITYVVMKFIPKPPPIELNPSSSTSSSITSFLYTWLHRPSSVVVSPNSNNNNLEINTGSIASIGNKPLPTPLFSKEEIAQVPLWDRWKQWYYAETNNTVEEINKDEVYSSSMEHNLTSGATNTYNNDSIIISEYKRENENDNSTASIVYTSHETNNPNEVSVEIETMVVYSIDTGNNLDYVYTVNDSIVTEVSNTDSDHPSTIVDTENIEQLNGLINTEVEISVTPDTEITSENLAIVDNNNIHELETSLPIEDQVNQPADSELSTIETSTISSTTESSTLDETTEIVENYNEQVNSEYTTDTSIEEIPQDTSIPIEDTNVVDNKDNINEALNSASESFTNTESEYMDDVIAVVEPETNHEDGQAEIMEEIHDIPQEENQPIENINNEVQDQNENNNNENSEIIDESVDEAVQNDIEQESEIEPYANDDVSNVGEHHDEVHVTIEEIKIEEVETNNIDISAVEENIPQIVVSNEDISQDNSIEDIPIPASDIYKENNIIDESNIMVHDNNNNEIETISSDALVKEPEENDPTVMPVEHLHTEL